MPPNNSPSTSGRPSTPVTHNGLFRSRDPSIRDAAATNERGYAHILVVNSDPVECARLGHAVVQLGYAVALVCDAAEAKALLATGSFDLVMLEIDPPDSSARLATKRLLHRIPCPVVLLSATPDATALLESSRVPRAYALAKPTDGAALRDLLHRLLPV